jgi:TIR domain/Helicase associated domain
VSARPNRKHQRLAREIAKRDGLSYQAALAQVRTAGQKPDNGGAARRHTTMLEGPGEPRAFISYSHRDEVFVLALVQRLKEYGIGVWIDRVDLLVGDSLVRRIGDAIHDEDFVVAVISEHSVNSSWCEKELSLAVTHGIQSKQVKVLPVRLDGIALPNFLGDTLWVEADRSDCIAVAAELATAMERHLERQLGEPVVKTDSSSVGEAERQRPVMGREPIKRNGASWEHMFSLLQRFIAREKTTLVPREHLEEGRTLGRWVKKQRDVFNGVHGGGRLTKEQIDKLVALPGWTWEPGPDKWELGYRALVAFQKREGHTKVPAKHTENGMRLDAWVTRQRQHFRMGRIQRQGDHVARLEGVPGWKWSESYAERWDRYYAALVKFVEHEGHANVPAKHVEAGVMLGQWVRNQRQRFRWLQAHHPLRIARLEALPGWTW